MKYSKLKAGITTLLALLLLITPIPAFAVGETVYTNSRWLADNLEYVNTITWSSSPGRTESFSVRMTGPGDAYPVVMNGDTVYGAFQISKMVSYAESIGKNVLAVVNTDFFSMQTGIPLGIVIEDGAYKSSPSGRNAVCFDTDGSVYIIEKPYVGISLYNHGQDTPADDPEDPEAPGETDETDEPDGQGDGNDNESNAGKVVNLCNFNKFRADTGGLYLFSEAFSTISTRTSSPGWFVRFRIVEGEPTVSGTMTLEVAELLRSDGAVNIGEGYIVLTAANQSGFGAEFEKFAVGDVVTMTTTASDERLENTGYATGAGCVLISEGAIADPDGWDSQLLARAPRTAFGLREDGTVVSYVIDGRSSTHSVGLTLDELADEMLRQGCVYAVNFDGGGSSALSVRVPGESTAKLVSRPSGGSERSCATYILFVTDVKPGGQTTNLSLKNDGVIVLAGSSVELAYSATDAGYMPSGLPADIKASPTGLGASVDGSLYTAGSAAGIDKIILSSQSTGASGAGEIFVITRPTSITPTRSGSSTPLTRVRLVPGEVLKLDVSATYYRRVVFSQLHSYTFTVTGDIGEMTEPGVFVAGQTMHQAGTITISAGGRSVDIAVETGGFLDMQGHWAREYAEYLAIAGIVTGVTPTEYVPERMMTRGEFCLMLYRSAGTPAFVSTGGFDDVFEDMYYAKAIAWARETGIAEAVEGNNFNPTEPLARQDAFTFIYRALDILGKQYEDGTSDDLAAFGDAAVLADYAVVPAATLVKLGIVEGTGGGLEPLSSFTRAQMAKLIATVLQMQEESQPDEGIPEPEEELPLPEEDSGLPEDDLQQPQEDSP